MKKRRDSGGYHTIFPVKHAQKAGRQCKYVGCTTILSVYTKGKYCGLHARKIMFGELMKRDDRTWTTNIPAMRRI
jgi:hypothetical protein